MKHFIAILAIAGLATACTLKKGDEIKTEDLLPEWTFTTGIEGPAADRHGNIYAVNYQREGTIGIVRADPVFRTKIFRFCYVLILSTVFV